MRIIVVEDCLVSVSYEKVLNGSGHLGVDVYGSFRVIGSCCIVAFLNGEKKSGR